MALIYCSPFPLSSTAGRLRALFFSGGEPKIFPELRPETVKTIVMKRRGFLALLFLLGISLGVLSLYRARPPLDSTPPGLRELMLSSIQNGRLDLTRLRLASRWDRLCLVPRGTTNADFHRKFPFLRGSWKLSEHSEVESAPVLALLLIGAGDEPVGVADLPLSRIPFSAARGACLARARAILPANEAPAP